MKTIDEIWLIDEDEDDLYLYCEALNEMGVTCPVECYNNPLPAITGLRTLPRHRRCLLIVGDRMPLLDGIDLLHLLYRECLLARHEAILLHGLLSPIDQERIAMLRIRSLEKPGSFRELKAIFYQLLPAHQTAA